MKRRYYSLVKIEQDHRITRETDPEFWYHLQDSLLLALKEEGVIDLYQYRKGREALIRRKRENFRPRQSSGRSV